jgi:DNA helicase IV
MAKQKRKATKKKPTKKQLLDFEFQTRFNNIEDMIQAQEDVKKAKEQFKIDYAKNSSLSTEEILEYANGLLQNIAQDYPLLRSHQSHQSHQSLTQAQSQLEEISIPDADQGCGIN